MTLIGCSYHGANKIGNQKGCSCKSENEHQKQQNNSLSSLNLHKFTTTPAIFGTIDKYKVHIKNCLKHIEKNRSIFNNVNQAVSCYIQSLESNREESNSNALHNLAMIDDSSVSANHKDPNFTCLRSLIGMEQSLSTEIKKIEENLSIENSPDMIELFSKIIQQEDTNSKLTNILPSILLNCCNNKSNKVYMKETNPLSLYGKDNDNLLLNEIDTFILYRFFNYFNILIRYAFNKCILQGGINTNEAQKQHDQVLRLMKSTYSAKSINNYRTQVVSLFKTAANDTPKKGTEPTDNDISTIKKLSKDSFKYIDDTIEKAIPPIQYVNASSRWLKDEITQIINMFHNIVSIYIIFEVLLDFSTIAALNRIDLKAWREMYNLQPVDITPLPAFTKVTLQQYKIDLIKFMLLNDSHTKNIIDECTERYINVIRYIVGQTTLSTLRRASH
ncbi:hypothetical protein [Cardinium endosymbiont of Nabis limbatus]|uniref:hypothetical protein n=1 Tax=Cardinium endosymbiont of Nabis limbatus TaxID=3066217 RepID=UPI003AF3D013